MHFAVSKLRRTILRMCRVAFLMMSTLVAIAGEAATSYRLERNREGWPAASLSSVKVTVDGSNVRVDFERIADEPVILDIALSRDGGKTFTAVNNELKTWYRMDTSPFVLYPSPLSGMTGKAAVRHVKWSAAESERDRTADAPTYQRELSYVLEERFDEIRVEIKCTAEVRIWTTTKLNANLWPSRVAFATGIVELDAQIATRVDFREQFPERIVVIASKQYEGGSPTTETITMNVVEVESVENVASDFFERPRGYVEQAPVIAAPGS